MWRVNLEYIMHDPNHFSNPMEFNPARFLDADGKFVKNERMVPFGIGKILIYEPLEVTKSR